MASTNLRKVRRTHTLGQDRLMTLLNKQGKEIYDHDKITEQIEELYTKLYESE